MTPAHQGHLAMLVFSTLVAGSFSLGSMVANEISPLALNAVRFVLAAAVIWGALLAGPGVPRRAFRAPWRYGVLGGLFAIYFVLMFEGLKTAPPVSASAVFTLVPVMAGGFGWLLLRQRTTARMALALLIGALGALWVIFRADLGAMLAFDVGRGEALYFTGCVSHAVYIPLVRLLNRGEAPAVFALGTLVGGAVILVVYGWADLWATPWLSLPGLVWITLVYVAVFASSATFVLLQFAAMRLPSAKVMAYTYLTPSWVIIWELALGHGALPVLTLAGVGLTVVALLLLLRDEEGGVDHDRPGLAARGGASGGDI
jgi:drug/metabolite transporter (DMT)-like permease